MVSWKSCQSLRSSVIPYSNSSRRHVDNLRKRYVTDSQCNKDTVDDDLGPTITWEPQPIDTGHDEAPPTSDFVPRRSTRVRHPPAREPGLIYY